MSLTFSGGGANSASATAGSVDWLDLTSQLSVVGGYLSGRFNTTGLYNLWFGYAAASDPQSVAGSENVGLGTFAAFHNQGDSNTWVGSRAGFENLGGSENVGVGWSAGGRQTTSSGNTSLGFRGGMSALGHGNVSVGHGANSGGADSLTDCNIAVGAGAHASGGDSIAIGPDVVASGRQSVALGPGSTVSGDTTVAVGPDVTSSGNNSLLLMPRPDGGRTTHTEDEELNVYGVLRGGREGGGAYAVSLHSDKVDLGNGVSRLSLNSTGLELYSDRNISFLSPAVFTNPITVSDTAVFSAPVVASDGLRVSLGSSVFDGPVVFNGPVSFPEAPVTHETLRADTTVTRDLVVENEAAFSNRAVFSDDVRFLGTAVAEGLVLNGALEALGGADVGGDLAVTGATVGNEIDMASGRVGALLVTDLEVTGSVILPDGFLGGAASGPLSGPDAQLDSLSVRSNVTVRGALSTNGTAQFRDARAAALRVDDSLLARGAATFEKDLHVTGAAHCRDVHAQHAHAHKVLACQVTATQGGFSNVSATRIQCHRAEVDHLIVHTQTTALSNESVITSRISADFAALGQSTLCNLAAARADVSDLRADSVAAGQAAFSNLLAPDASIARAAVGSAAIGSNVVWLNQRDTLSNHRWTASLEYDTHCNTTADLAFVSTNGTRFALTDTFEAGVLNFTGKHRCSWSGPATDPPEPGLLVSTTGRFDNLDGGGRPTMDESLPVVSLTRSERDPRAFGVVAGHEAPGSRVFRLANLVFSHGHPGDAKLILNSVGEGGMWVCDANGPVSDGDLLTSSPAPGYAQAQGDDVVRSHTVAKVTGRVAPWEPLPGDPRGRRRAFAGVVYKF